MNNFYLLSFPGGLGGDFLSTRIMNDESFYETTGSIIDENNKYKVIDILKPFNVNLKDSVVIDDQTRDLICNDPFLQNKKILLRSHKYSPVSKINLPFTKAIRISVKRDSKLIPFYYTLLCIKDLCIKDPFEDNKLYFFEKLAKERKLKNSITLFREMYFSYKLDYFARSEGWIFYDNIDNLYLDPKSNVKEFSELFDLKESIDSIIIENYFQANVNLVETTFNKTLDSYLKGDWMADIIEYAKKNCPGYYNIE